MLVESSTFTLSEITKLPDFICSATWLLTTFFVVSFSSSYFCYFALNIIYIRVKAKLLKGSEKYSRLKAEISLSVSLNSPGKNGPDLWGHLCSTWSLRKPGSSHLVFLPPSGALCPIWLKLRHGYICILPHRSREKREQIKAIPYL